MSTTSSYKYCPSTRPEYTLHCRCILSSRSFFVFYTLLRFRNL
nr:hypothetical protein Iba_chr12fCG19080 [Ipomoea batatas]